MKTPETATKSAVTLQTVQESMNLLPFLAVCPMFSENLFPGEESCRELGRRGRILATAAVICPIKGFLMSRTNIFNHCKHLAHHTARPADFYSNSLLTHFLFLFLFVGQRPNGTRQPGTEWKRGAEEKDISS